VDVDTIKVRYIGTRASEVDPITRLTWTPGLVQEVPADRARYLLWYRDRYADARPSATRRKEPVFPEQPPVAAVSHDMMDDGLPTINLAYVDESAIREYAEKHFNVTLAAEIKRDDMVSRVRELMRLRG
jgi:hypothetical protein